MDDLKKESEASAGRAASVVERLVITDICQTCGEHLSIDGGTSKTLVGYISPPGHNHDDNCRKRLYKCVNGHSFVVSKINTCPACDWVGKKDCFCCPNGKQDKWPNEL